MADNVFTSISNIDYGASKDGLESLKEDIQLSMIKEAKEALGNTQPIASALIKGWAGDDRVVFYNNLTKMEKEIEGKLDEYYSALTKQLDGMYDAWTQFQQTNVK